MAPRAGPSSSFAPRRSGREGPGPARSGASESSSDEEEISVIGDDSSDEGGDEAAPRKRRRGDGGGAGAGASQADQASLEKAREVMGRANFDSKVAEVIKLALMMEQRKQPLRRDDVNKKILGTHARLFKPILAEVNRLLRTRFGMQLVMLRAKGQADGQAAAQAAGASGAASATQGRNGRAAETQEDDDGEEVEATQTNGAGGRNKGKGKGKGKRTAEDDEEDGEAPAGRKEKGGTSSRSYILRSNLPAELLPLLSVPQPLRAANPLSGGGAGTGRKDDSGAILELAQDAGGGTGGPGFTGLTWTILGLTLVNDRSMTETALLSILKSKLDLQHSTVLPFVPPTATGPAPTLEVFLKTLARQGYIEQIKADGAAPRNAEGGVEIEWQWGPRADAEIGEKAVARFLFDLSESQRNDDDEQEVAHAPRRGRRDAAAGDAEQVETAETRKNKMLRNIEKAAGGVLVG